VWRGVWCEVSGLTSGHGFPRSKAPALTDHRKTVPVSLSSPIDVAFGELSESVADDEAARVCLVEWWSRVPDPRLLLGALASAGVRVGVGVCAYTAAGHEPADAVGEWATGCDQATLTALGGRRDPFTRRTRPPSARTRKGARRGRRRLDGTDRRGGGLTRITVHRRFANRQALLEALAVSAKQQLIEAIEQARPDSAPALVALYRVTANALHVKSAWRFTLSHATQRGRRRPLGRHRRPHRRTPGPGTTRGTPRPRPPIWTGRGRCTTRCSAKP
jgi:hypothetical protein